MRLPTVAVAAWLLNGQIALLGVNEGSRIWVHSKPGVDAVPEPGSHHLGPTAGLPALPQGSLSASMLQPTRFAAAPTDGRHPPDRRRRSPSATRTITGMYSDRATVMILRTRPSP